jgi:hypothetical protein
MLVPLLSTECGTKLPATGYPMSTIARMLFFGQAPITEMLAACIVGWGSLNSKACPWTEPARFPRLPPRGRRNQAFFKLLFDRDAQLGMSRLLQPP